MTFGARDTSFPYSSDGTDGWTASGNICYLQPSPWQTLLLNVSLRTNWSLQKAWCNHQQQHQTGSSFLPWVNDIIFLFRNISPAGSHWSHCLPKCNQLFVQVPGCLSAPQVLPFLQEWPHPVPTPPTTHTSHKRKIFEHLQPIAPGGAVVFAIILSVWQYYSCRWCLRTPIKAGAITHPGWM